MRQRFAASGLESRRYAVPAPYRLKAELQTQFSDMLLRFWSLSFQASEVSKYQLWQIIAVTALQQAENRNPQAAKPLAQPIVIFRFQCFLGQGVVGIGVEPGGD